MKLMDQYLYAVTRYLPEASRRDVKNELKANIEDMLPEHYTEEEVRGVLQKLGDPKELASQYHLNKRYLIGPAYYDQYLAVLKLVVGIAATVLGAIVILSWLVDAPVPRQDLDSGVSTAVAFMAAFFGAVIEGGVQAALWVTVIFVILERSGVALDERTMKGREWTPEDLKDIPLAGADISRPAIIVAMLFAILFLALLWFQPELLSIYRDSGDGLVRTPLLNTDRLAVYLPFFLAVTVLEIAHLSWQYVAGRWTMPLAMANAVINAVSLVLAFVMLRDPRLYSEGFPAELGRLFNISQEAARANLDRSLTILLVLIILLTIWDTVEKFWKARKIRLDEA